jgi:hypothetical protein
MMKRYEIRPAPQEGGDGSEIDEPAEEAQAERS